MIGFPATRGFTLLEIAIVLAILGLLLGALVSPLAMQLELRRIEETRRTLDRVEQALLGFAVSRGRLPCADVEGDGVENRDASGGCAPGALEGTLPWITLGISATDAWGRALRYRVSAEFTRSVGTGMPPAPDRLDLYDTRGDIDVLTRGAERAVSALAADVPVVFLSTGPNAVDGMMPAGADEAENVDGDGIFFRRLQTRAADGCDDDTPAAPLCEFDDLVRWIPAPILLYQLVQAGRLP